MSSNLPVVAIIPGWAEGKWLTREFRHSLEANGFAVSDDHRSADIIFAHSLGCYRVPKNASAKAILLVGVPFGPTRLLPRDISRKLRAEAWYHYRHHLLPRWSIKLAYGIMRIVADPWATYLIFTIRKPENLPPVRAREVVFVCPEADAIMVPYKQQVPKGKGYAYIEVPGEHDSCWSDPVPYIDIIKSLC